MEAEANERNERAERNRRLAKAKLLKKRIQQQQQRVVPIPIPAPPRPLLQINANTLPQPVLKPTTVTCAQLLPVKFELTKSDTVSCTGPPHRQLFEIFRLVPNSRYSMYAYANANATKELTNQHDPAPAFILLVRDCKCWDFPVEHYQSVGIVEMQENFIVFY